MTVDGLADGENAITLKALSSSGFSSLVSTNVIKDSVSPVVVISEPINGQIYTTKPILIIR